MGHRQNAFYGLSPTCMPLQVTLKMRSFPDCRGLQLFEILTRGSLVSLGGRHDERVPLPNAISNVSESSSLIESLVRSIIELKAMFMPSRGLPERGNKESGAVAS